MRQPFEHWDRRYVKCVSCKCLEGTDPPLAENNVFIAFGHNVFSAHQPLFYCVCQPAFQQDRLFQLTQLLKQSEVLHVARAHLYDVHILKKRYIGNIHDFSDNRQLKFFFPCGKQPDPLLLQPLKSIWRGSRFKRPPAQKIGAAALNLLTDLQNLLRRLYRAGARDDGKVPTAYLLTTYRNHRVVFMKFPVCFFIRFRYPAHIFYNVDGLDRINVNRRSIPNQPDNCRVFARTEMGAKVLLLQLMNQLVNLVGTDVFLENHNHFLLPRNAFFRAN